ncbi:acetolactate synthase large subunit [Actinomadura graeca]|uniref:Acetolactate synthase large subunit n=1 Tax=Actinomadura graeca TaxID=2750812 RepID=A0ABX8QUJ4_9ACTN|nr:acetolactate synthase large subunit [Actinomadura graeca]QXJ22410.1 acetolactate synthase large subunit [Actinomadura graeca]
MNGAESLMRTAAAAGADVCFANLGTSEVPLAGALDRVPAIRPVLGPHEAVCTGAADGYGRMTGRPALAVLHCGPGLANGLASLHNARRAGTPAVVVVGDQATWHAAADAPLTTDVPAVADPFCAHVGRCESAEGMARDMADAIGESARGPACLAVPADLARQEVREPGADAALRRRRPVDGDRVARAADALRRGGTAVLFLGGGALSREGLLAAGAVARATGCRLVHETFPARIERGGALPAPARLPHPYDDAAAMLADVSAVVLAGAREPVSSFGYAGRPSGFVPDGADLRVLAGAPQDCLDDAVDALERLADRVGAAPAERTGRRAGPPAVPSGPLTPETFAAAVAAAQPADAIVVDESLTSGFGYHRAAEAAPPHTCMVAPTGGAIGHGLPLATGAAVACPDRPVLLIEGDGSALYTVQALWTQARENLDVTTVICDNAGYEIVKWEVDKAEGVGPSSEALLSLDRPGPDWVGVAEALGVPAARAATAKELGGALRAAFAEPGPHLVEAKIRRAGA